MANSQNSRATGCLIGGLIGLIGATGVLFLTLGWLMTREPPRPPGSRPTAVVWTATPAPRPTVTSTPTVTPPPPATPPPPTPTTATGIAIGSRVRVSGTGNAGLNLRSGAGLNYERVDIAAEGEVFIVAGGPREADGLTWWLLKDEADPAREGWGAANYLHPTP
ncbi:MAG: hypothetical protein ACP5HM_09400 [Anaerolineae bacterium]